MREKIQISKMFSRMINISSTVEEASSTLAIPLVSIFFDNENKIFLAYKSYLVKNYNNVRHTEISDMIRLKSSYLINYKIKNHDFLSQ